MPFDDFTLTTYREPEFHLSRGAHWERKDGVCVLEAALERAGFPHQRVTDAEEMPHAFSRVLCDYAMALNDALPDDLRTLLLEPYTRRLFGTGADSDIERKRLKFIWEAIFRRILLEKPEETLVFVDLVCGIACSRYPRKWELAVEILDDAAAIGKQSRKGHY